MKRFTCLLEIITFTSGLTLTIIGIVMGVMENILHWIPDSPTDDTLYKSGIGILFLLAMCVVLDYSRRVW